MRPEIGATPTPGVAQSPRQSFRGPGGRPPEHIGAVGFIIGRVDVATEARDEPQDRRTLGGRASWRRTRAPTAILELRSC